MLISTWDAATQGTGRTTVVGKAARDCTKQEVSEEVWATFKDRYGYDPAFQDRHLHSWYLDPALVWGSGGGVTNDEVLSVGTWAKRPHGETAIPNLFLGGDYNQNMAAGTANMESGNLCGRIAAQRLVEESGRWVPSIQIWQRLSPPHLDGIKALDAGRYALGLPNRFEPAAGGLDQIADFVDLVVRTLHRVLGR